MSRNVTDIQTLGTKFAVGEIADFVGVPNYYDAGDSKWLRTGAWVSASLVPASLVNALKAASATSVALTDNALVNEAYATINGMIPPAVVGSTRCFSYASNIKGYNAHAFVVNADGAQVISIGQTTGFDQSNYGCGNLITSDGTKFWSWTAASTSAFGAKSSTDALGWSAETLTGLPTFSSLTAHQIGGTASTSGSYPVGDLFQAIGSANLVAAFCGARHLLIGTNASGNYVATLSSNGTTFGGDQSTSVLGSTTITQSVQTWWYRNGNNFYITLGSSGISRFTGDGGVTWAVSTNAPSNIDFYRVNATDPARVMAFTGNSTTAKVTTNSGQTWTNVNLPVVITITNTYTCGRGAVWAFAQSGTAYKSTNDGVTWAPINAPVGFGAISAVYADANRWYLYSAASNQIATSTDLATWTIRNISTPIPNAGTIPTSFVAIDSNVVAGAIQGNILYTSDGGVTWYWSYMTNASAATAAGVSKIIANTVGTPMILSAPTTNSGLGAVYIPATALSSTPIAVRSTAIAVTPLRTNSLAFSRVA